MMNEEKILDVLSAVQQQIGEINNHMSKMDDRMSKMDDRMSKMDEKIDRIDLRVTRTEMCIENEIKPAIALLAEGQKTILETLAPKSRVDELEDEVKFLKSFVFRLGEDMERLKKAQ